MTVPRAAALSALDKAAADEIAAAFAALCSRLPADKGITTPDQEYADTLTRLRTIAAVYTKMHDMIEKVFT